MDNYLINHDLSEYNNIEGIEFGGLMPKFLETVGLVTGESNKTGKLFEFHPAGSNSLATIDTHEIMNQDSDSPSPEPKPEPIEIETEFDFIYNESSYNAAMENDPLKRYYNDYPEEDCYNTVENRPCNYNDRLYIGTIDGEEVNGRATWASENAQIITIGNDQYYAAIFYGFNPQSLELFNDINLSESVGKTFVITQVAYNEDCPHSWNAVNKDAFPWCAVNLPIPFNGTVKFVYDETNIVERQINSEHGYYIVQIAGLFGSEYKINENDQTTFDSSKLIVKLVTEE